MQPKPNVVSALAAHILKALYSELAPAWRCCRRGVAELLPCLSLRRRLPERHCKETSKEQEYPGCGDGKVSLRNVVSISTHDTPVGSAPANGTDELIKASGIVQPSIKRDRSLAGRARNALAGGARRKYPGTGAPLPVARPPTRRDATIAIRSDAGPCATSTPNDARAGNAFSNRVRAAAPIALA